MAAAPCFAGEWAARAGEAEAREDEVVALAGEEGGAASRDSTAAAAAAAADPARFAGEAAAAAAAAGLAAAGASAGPRIRSIISFPLDLLALRTPVAGCCLVTASSQSCSNSSMFSLCCRSEYVRKA